MKHNSTPGTLASRARATFAFRILHSAFCIAFAAITAKAALPSGYTELDYCGLGELAPGDLIQLGDGTGRFYHCLVVLRPGPDPRVAAHDYDALDRPLSDYLYARSRFLHVEGVRP